MKQIKWLLPVMAALTLLAGCKQELRIAAAEFEDSIDAGGFDAGVTVTCSMQYLTGGVPQAVMDGINAAIVGNHLLFDEAEGSADVPAAARTWVEATLADNGVDLEEINESNAWMYKWTFSREGEFTGACKARKLQTYQGSYSDYTGGAHGIYGLGCDVFDLGTGEKILEEDLFIDDYYSPLCDILAEAADASVPEEDREMLFGTPEPNGNFAVSEEGITWVYNPYEIAAYASGIIEVPVSWEALKPLLQPRWR
ncbi:MAG: DUF3298 domain-containing protein [Bacteroidales bacterium]|jgi:hypothetical protein|nr:DUF3298 domain-containing protein [Bacteroidales bacterium]